MGIRIIVGIGNPGASYEGTRHNLGFRVVEDLTERHTVSSSRKQFHAQTDICSITGKYAVCLRPMMFVNNSGSTVCSALDYYNASLNDLCVVCDDVNLDSGIIRMKRAGSSGGHRGLESIVEECRSDRFPRLKIGIGGDYTGDMASYVLGAYTGEEQKILEQAVSHAADAVETWLHQGIEQSMNIYN